MLRSTGRLAIIDLDDRAKQPMASGDGRLLLLFNGEIYNYRELRTELEAQGVAFRTQSDAEVMLEGYARWGEDVLPKLRGMFAFLIWDRRDNVLFAARDPFGIKPLYFVNAAQGVAFGSEIKQLLDLPRRGTAAQPRSHLGFPRLASDRSHRRNAVRRRAPNSRRPLCTARSRALAPG